MCLQLHAEASSVTVSHLSAARKEVPWMIDAERCEQLSHRSLSFCRACTCGLPCLFCLPLWWWSEKADLPTQGEFALLIHSSQCWTSECYCMLHCKHGGRHLASSSKGCSLWFLTLISVKSDIGILHWSILLKNSNKNLIFLVIFPSPQPYLVCAPHMISSVSLISCIGSQIKSKKLLHSPYTVHNQEILGGTGNDRKVFSSLSLSIRYHC